VDVLCCRRKNSEKPHNRYLVAVYKCQEGFSLQDPSADRLYCSEDEWVGEQPVCTATSNDSLPLFYDILVLFSSSYLFFKCYFSNLFEQDDDFDICINMYVHMCSLIHLDPAHTCGNSYPGSYDGRFSKVKVKLFLCLFK
jgi:hypothetical protein